MNFFALLLKCEILELGSSKKTIWDNMTRIQFFLNKIAPPYLTWVIYEVDWYTYGIIYNTRTGILMVGIERKRAPNNSSTFSIQYRSCVMAWQMLLTQPNMKCFYTDYLLICLLGIKNTKFTIAFYIYVIKTILCLLSWQRDKQSNIQQSGQRAYL